MLSKDLEKIVVDSWEVVGSVQDLTVRYHSNENGLGLLLSQLQQLQEVISLRHIRRKDVLVRS